ncbi:rhodanese-like domain-containing protein [Leptolyngbya sp. CCNP1308]|uniref:rhodanese-like domain-containing protein n=1 Tax=Leptolyngbya sp. CCNP1308 TaxID=3110255 RepID=UPI002B21C608|nr:rhodanese-like domain-containing protein [Leptolyngbya sp. CCNP1308]MEA5451895.1 rhodanese-like domain-containing protein [Leptolyngbya sp. CCNP1308]
MIVNQSVRAVMLALVLGVCLWLGLGPNLAIAAPLSVAESSVQDRVQTLPDASLELKAAVDRTLTAIPAGFYKVDDVAGFKRLQANAQAQVVDVREPAEYTAGHIPEAINIPLRTLAQHLDQIERDRPVVLYCSSGYRSAMGVVTLHLLGYENVQGFPPSFAGWKAAGEAIVRA